MSFIRFFNTFQLNFSVFGFRVCCKSLGKE